MADAASFVVALIDKVTGPARKQAKALESLQEQIAKTGKIGAQHHDGAAGMSPKALAIQNRSNLMMLAGAKAGGMAGRAIEGVTNAAIGMAKWSAIGAGVIGVGLGGALVKSTVDMALFEDRTMTAFRSLTGSVEGGKKAWESSLALSRELGGGIEETAGAMTHLLAMQFKLPEAEEMIRISADLKAVTGDAHSAERALTAITQIKAKGKLQAEELVGQLAEAGVSTTLVYEQLQKSMNLKSNQDVMKAITAGKVTSDIGIEAIKNAILHKTHSEKAGAAGGRYAQETFGGLLGRLRNAPQFLFQRLGESIAKNLEKFKPVVEKIIAAIDGIQGDQMTRFVGNVLTFMSQLVPLTLEFAKGFGEGFSAMNDAMSGVDPAQSSLETAKELGHALASAFEMAFKAIKMVADLVVWLDQHRGVAAGVAGMLAIDKVAGAGATAKGLWGAGKWAAGRLGGGAAAAAAAQAAAGAGAFGSLGGAAAATGGAGAGATGLAALGLGGGLALAGAGVGLGAAAAGYVWREEIANWMYGTGGEQGTRGLGAPTPTGTLNALQGATAQARPNNNVKFDSQIHIDGTGHDPNEIARQVGDQQRGMLEQFFQGQALESGATG